MFIGCEKEAVLKISMKLNSNERILSLSDWILAHIIWAKPMLSKLFFVATPFNVKALRKLLMAGSWYF